MNKLLNIKHPQIINIDDTDINISILKALKGANPVFMLELGSIYILIAAPTLLGVQALNKIKNRAQPKTFCSVIGSVSNFLSAAKVDQLSYFFNGNLNFFESLEGSFIRIPVGKKDLETPAILNGTHQGLLLPKGQARNIFENIEKMYYGLPSSPLFPHSNYRAPLCSSANLSGDTRGAITDLNTAKYFAKEANIPLIITDKQRDKNLNHFPILNLIQDKISIERASEHIYQLLENVHSSIKIQMVF